MKWGVLLLALAVAGCARPSAAPPGVPTDARGHELPTLHGVVVDEAVHPLAGAVVRVLGGDLDATTDDQGRYAFRQPALHPEAALVSAWKPGYVAQAQQIQVSGRLSQSLDFTLKENPFSTPSSEVRDDRGSIGCRGEVVASRDRHPFACQLEDHSVLPSNVWETYFERDLAGVIVEVHWSPESPLTQRLAAELKGPVAGGHGDGVLATAEGLSPLRLVVTQEMAHAFPDWTGIRLTVNVSANSTNADPGLGFSQGQPFHAYAAVFYREPAPADYAFDATGT